MNELKKIIREASAKPRRAPRKRNPGPPQPVVILEQVVAPKKKRQRRRKPKNSSQNLVQYSPSANMSRNALIPQALGASTQSRANLIRERMRVARGAKLSPEGLKFLKCAFSAADFDGSGTYGVPDDFTGKSTAVKHRLVRSIAIPASTDMYILISPVPGAAYFSLTKAAGTPVVSTDVFNQLTYADYASIFGTVIANGTQNTTKFRFVSNHFEMVPTTNNNSWTGSVQVFKIPVQVTFDRTVTTVNGYNRLMVTGLNSINTDNADMYSGPFNLGAYVGAFNKGAVSWDFSDIWQNQTNVPFTIEAQEFMQLGGNGGQINGFDNNMESILIKISGGGTNPNNSFILRTWACVEYQFSPGTVMYEMQNTKNAKDELALELYRRIVNELPTAVSFLDNANFWSRVLTIIKQISGGVSLIPGPYGAIGGGINAVASAIEQLTM
jgi:hypothetical protein